MNFLEKHKDLKIEHRIEAEKKHEFKIIGSQKKRRGQKLYAFNRDSKEVYEVEIKTIDKIDISKKNVSTHKAIINPKHPMIWAINLKNAQRKFKKYENI